MNKLQKDQKYLPDFLKDFHDQKDVFKLIDKYIVSKMDTGPSKMPNWVEAHIYTIDAFLWIMAFYGYKLQKSRVDAEYGDLQSDIDRMKDEDVRIFKKLLESR